MRKLIKSATVFLQSKRDSIRFWIEILTGFSTVVSAIIVVLTLYEMQVQRNNAYMPDIIFETVSVNVSWGDSEKLNDYDSIVGEATEVNPSSVHIPVRNIGVGVAKKISFTISDENFISWLSLFNKLNPESQYTYTKNGSMLSVFNGNTQISFNSDYRDEKTFLLPNAEEIYEFTIPMQYTILLQKIFSTRNAEPVDIPDLEIWVSFEDVQGVTYDKAISLAIEDYFFTQDSDGNGMATYQIVMR